MKQVGRYRRKDEDLEHYSEDTSEDEAREWQQKAAQEAKKSHCYRVKERQGWNLEEDKFLTRLYSCTYFDTEPAMDKMRFSRMQGKNFWNWLHVVDKDNFHKEKMRYLLLGIIKDFC